MPESPPIQSAVQASFTVTYILLLTTATITFIEALRTPIPFVRHVLNLETAISLIASYFYSLFVGMLQQKTIDWKEFTTLRYLDWSITTPLMLIALCLVCGSATNVPIEFPVIATILVLNYAMLLTGYLGEQGYLDRITATLLGFAPFVVMFYMIYKIFLSKKYILSNYVFYFIFLVVWSMYGVAYLLENEEWKNIAMNILDCLAKCLVGIGLFLFYAKVIV